MWGENGSCAYAAAVVICFARVPRWIFYARRPFAYQSSDPSTFLSLASESECSSQQPRVDFTRLYRLYPHLNLRTVIITLVGYTRRCVFQTTASYVLLSVMFSRCNDNRTVEYFIYSESKVCATSTNYNTVVLHCIILQDDVKISLKYTLR